VKKIYCTLVLIIVVFLCSCTPQTSTSKTDTSVKLEENKNVNLKIVVTDKQLYNMVNDITGNKHTIEFMFNNKNDEKNFLFTDDSVENISKKDLFIYMGASNEPWINGFYDKLNKNKVGVINVSRGVKLLQLSKEQTINGIVIKDNPYYMLNLDNYRIALLNIKNAIEDKDPQNRDYYEKNFSLALKNFDTLQQDLKKMSDKLKDYAFVTENDDLDYFTKFCGLKTIKLSSTDILSNKLTPQGGTDNVTQALKSVDYKNLIYLYTDDTVLKNDEDFIKKFQMTPLNMIANKDNVKYMDIIKYDFANLIKLVNP
jgi:zinc/manganese transport system substrate-binding protein